MRRKRGRLMDRNEGCVSLYRGCPLRHLSRMDVASRAEGTEVTPYWPNHTHTHFYTHTHTHTHKPPTSLKHPPHPSPLASRHLEPEGLPVSPPLPDTRPSSWGRKGPVEPG